MLLKRELQVRPMVADCVRASCEVFGVNEKEVRGPRRFRYLAQPRHAAMYVAHKRAGASLNKIGRLVGNRDHTTVMNAVRVVGKRLTDEREEWPQIIQTIEQRAIELARERAELS